MYTYNIYIYMHYKYIYIYIYIYIYMKYIQLVILRDYSNVQIKIKIIQQILSKHEQLEKLVYFNTFLSSVFAVAFRRALTQVDYILIMRRTLEVMVQRCYLKNFSEKFRDEISAINSFISNFGGFQAFSFTKKGLHIR